MEHYNLGHASSSRHSLRDFTNDFLLFLAITVIELEITFSRDLKSKFEQNLDSLRANDE